MKRMSAGSVTGKARQVASGTLLVLSATAVGPVGAEQACPWIDWLAEVHGAGDPWRSRAVPFIASPRPGDSESNAGPEAPGTWWRLPGLQGLGQPRTRL